MSISAIASLRPLQGQCLRQARIGLLSVQITSRSATFNIRATIPLQPQQRRFQSDLKDAEQDGKDVQKHQSQKTDKKLTFRQLTGRAVTVSIRNLAYLMSPKGFRQVFRDSPISTTLILTLLVITFAFTAVQIRLLYKTFWNPGISRYPEPVASTLRRAIYYTTVSPNPDKALKYYGRAMGETQQLNMDPLCDEVLGIRIMIAFFLEKIDQFGPSANMLESVRKDCLDWVDNMEQQVKDGKVGEDGYLKPEYREVLASPPTPSEVSTEGEANQEPVKKWTPEISNETVYAQRERLLKKAVSTSVKLGELYADPHVLDQDASHRHLVWSVETTLKEFRRRREQGAPRPGEDKWLTPTEVGATMESLGRDYERKSQFHLAIPLFFQGLRNCDTPCHRAVIMNNLAACFAQHPIYSPADGGNSSQGGPETQSLKDMFDSSMPNTRKDCLEAAANWAKNAYSHAKDVKGEERTPECDEACAVALCNWGDVAAMQGNIELARKKYTQCIELSNKLEFPQGVKQAQMGLRKLTAPVKK